MADFADQVTNSITTMEFLRRSEFVRIVGKLAILICIN